MFIQKKVFTEIFIAVYQTQTIYADWSNRAASYLIVEECIDASVRLRTNKRIWLFKENQGIMAKDYEINCSKNHLHEAMNSTHRFA